MRDIKEIENRYEQRKNTQGKVNLFKKRYIVILILLIAIITNPSKERYKNKIVEIVDSSIGVSEYSSEKSTPHVDTLLDQILESYMNYSNYFLFSTISVEDKGTSKVVGFGAFGFIYIPDQLKEVLQSTE
ncbi:hypothetical protein [Dysgonomonas sp. Marseille-P4361]|uniref:hypothetical protein n=1 Tax=Dysgonomonas sp. Marseille-P4361 TaxID=2161820 RepID=UPI000D555909|nr:hypothetical protein [Dysgonomonas sp. Marseille-P4361]